ncbi:MAG: winged helix family transcriptional regulator, partial [Flavobacteriaceae bacterium]|nr:winged helix family transcriptional regulator [Flavobacteriaceae bacterium]
MSKKNIYSTVGFIIIMFLVWMFLDSEDKNISNSENIKVVLREVGHQLLLANQDSTSLVLPVLELDESNYQITFQKNLSIAPKYLVSTIHNAIEKSSLSTHYLVEIINCKNEEVAYSYEMENTQEKSITPCFGRTLNENCYFIEIHFLDRSKGAPIQTILYLLTIFIFITVLYFLNKRKEYPTKLVSDNSHKSIGIFKFYPDQNKLVKEAIEISLSKKECELLAIFIENPNQIIKREELMKRVWED